MNWLIEFEVVGGDFGPDGCGLCEDRTSFVKERLGFIENIAALATLKIVAAGYLHRRAF